MGVSAPYCQSETQDPSNGSADPQTLTESQAFGKGTRKESIEYHMEYVNSDVLEWFPQARES